MLINVIMSLLYSVRNLTTLIFGKEIDGTLEKSTGARMNT